MKAVKFSATWCGPCNMIAPFFHEASESEEFKNLAFEEVDVDDEEKSDLINKLHIKNIPTIVILDDEGEEVSRKVGGIPKKELFEYLKQYV